MKYRTQCCDQCHRRSELYYVRSLDEFLCEQCIHSDETRAAETAVTVEDRVRWDSN